MCSASRRSTTPDDARCSVHIVLSLIALSSAGHEEVEAAPNRDNEGNREHDHRQRALSLDRGGVWVDGLDRSPDHEAQLDEMQTNAVDGVEGERREDEVLTDLEDGSATRRPSSAASLSGPKTRAEVTKMCITK